MVLINRINYGFLIRTFWENIICSFDSLLIIYRMFSHIVPQLQVILNCTTTSVQEKLIIIYFHDSLSQADDQTD